MLMQLNWIELSAFIYSHIREMYVIRETCSAIEKIKKNMNWKEIKQTTYRIINPLKLNPQRAKTG